MLWFFRNLTNHTLKIPKQTSTNWRTCKNWNQRATQRNAKNQKQFHEKQVREA